MSNQGLKDRIATTIDSHSQEIIGLGESIANHPELGFHENWTSGLVKDWFRKLGIPYKDGLAITGVRGDLKGKSTNCKVAYLSELDALMCPSHPKADPNTGAAHACGHNIQVAVMLGIVQAMIETNAAAELDGDIAFIATPAEELGQIEERMLLKEQGVLSFLTGKQQMIAEGVFDDIDLAMMFHVQIPKVEGKIITTGGTMNGAIAKKVRYEGVAAHAGSGPHLGINALNAAMLGLQAINAQRETFREEDYVRVHPIITKGGTVVNSVPDDVRLELFVRAKTVDALRDTCKKVDRSFKAGALAVGAGVKIDNIPGYMPRIPHEPLDNIFSKNAAILLGQDVIGLSPHMNGSTDMGDLSQIMPAIHPWIHTVRGKMHGADFEITEPKITYIQSAKIIAWTLIDLLSDDARIALEIKDIDIPPMTKEEWFDQWQELIENS